MTSRHTVAHVTTAHRHNDNRILKKECVALATAGFDVVLIAPAERDHIIDGVPIKALPQRRTRLRRMLLGHWDVWRVLMSCQPRLIHVHDPELIPLAFVWGRLPGRRSVYDAHEDLPKQVMGKPYIPFWLRRPMASLCRRIERFADHNMDAIIAATPAIARNYRRAPVTLVQNFPWLRDFGPVKPLPSEGPTTFSYVGGITEERGGHEMVDVISAAVHDVALVLAGPASDGMQKRLSEHSDRVRYLGMLPVAQVPDVIEESHAGFVIFSPLPNHLECQPTKLFEYMAAGRPFIASNFPAWMTLFSGTDCGFFVDPQNRAAISQAVTSVVEDRKLAETMGQNGRNVLEKRFTFENEAEQLIVLTRDLIDSPTDEKRERSPRTANSGGSAYEIRNRI